MLSIKSLMCSLMSAHVLARLAPVSPVSSPQGPCHVELQRALDKIAKSQQKLGDKLTRFYLPNCDKRGLYKPKQVGTRCRVCSQCVRECA